MENRSISNDAENDELYKYVFSLLNSEDEEAEEIQTNEFGTFLRLIGRTPSNLEISRLVNELDQKKAGFVNFRIFCEYLAKTRTNIVKDQREELRKAFQVFDRFGIGFIPSFELKFVLNSVGDKMSDSEFIEMVKGTGFIRDGKFYYEGKWFC